MADADAVVDAADAVVEWAQHDLRDLPWRATRDPWKILVAEVMLQQTQAHRVVPKWERFLDRYGRPAQCAAAPLSDVLRLWQGLGYPRRARDLHRSAQLIVERHRGRVPDRLDALLALPGIGRYTARAVLAFAFERDVTVVDTNVARVLARTAGRSLTQRGAQDAADSYLPAGRSWLWNQAMIDIGARWCRPDPACSECPLATICRWHRSGHRPPDPARGSAGVSRSQPRYEGSARQARGRVLAALAAHEPVELAADDPILAGLVADGLVVIGAAGPMLPS
jgi:A/G-specific adenine glycosylase